MRYELGLLKQWAGDDPTTRMHVNSACFS